MKLAIALLAIALLGIETSYELGGFLQAQTTAIVWSDLQQAITHLAAIPVVLPPPADPVVAALKVPNTAGATLYDSLAACLPNCQVLAVVYTCAQPTQWAPSTMYTFGQLVADPAGNYYRLTAGAGTSGATAPAWTASLGASTVDGALTWTAAFISPTKLICSDSAVALK